MTTSTLLISTSTDYAIGSFFIYATYWLEALTIGAIVWIVYKFLS